jgi:hypothetical protein
VSSPTVPETMMKGMSWPLAACSANASGALNCGIE